MQQDVILSGIQPSGNLTIGNYIGAMSNWVELLDNHKCLFSIVDLHAITVKQTPKDLRERCYKFLALYIACGVDPDKATIFVQSHVPGHAQLCWILNCYTQMGELNRMTQFKEKSSRYKKNTNAGLFDYPVLMAADILLYNTNLVPVGGDQKQHLELTRLIANRFNKIYGDIFTIPEPYIPKIGARIMSLQEPLKKMSKSDDNPKNYVAILDTPSQVKKKIMSAVTDNDATVKYDEESKPGISNLMSIFSVISKKSIQEIENDFEGKNYGLFKSDLVELLVAFLRPIQKDFQLISNDKEYLDSILQKGAEEVNKNSCLMIDKLNSALGFIPKIT